MRADALLEFRRAIDAAAETDRRTFARRARNAAARAVLAASFGVGDKVSAPNHAAPVDEIRGHVGVQLGDELLALYEGREGWTSRAIDVLEPLNALARA